MSRRKEDAGKGPVMRVVKRRVADLVPYARNARTHGEAQLAQLVAAIRRWGWTIPILVDEKDMIIAGHGRVLAAQQIGMEEVPALVARGWSEEQKRAYVLADNQIPLGAEWDEDMLRFELNELHSLEFQITDIGFSDADLKKMLGSGEGEAGQDTTPQLAGLEYRVVVECDDEAQQSELLERFEGEGLKCRPLIS